MKKFEMIITTKQGEKKVKLYVDNETAASLKGCSEEVRRAYYSSMKRNGSVKTYYDRVKSVDSPCSFLLQISTKELGTDLQARVNFVIDSSVVTGVSVSSTLEF